MLALVLILGGIALISRGIFLVLGTSNENRNWSGDGWAIFVGIFAILLSILTFQLLPHFQDWPREEASLNILSPILIFVGLVSLIGGAISLIKGILSLSKLGNDDRNWSRDGWAIFIGIFAILLSLLTLQLLPLPQLQDWPREEASLNILSPILIFVGLVSLIGGILSLIKGIFSLNKYWASQFIVITGAILFAFGILGVSAQTRFNSFFREILLVRPNQVMLLFLVVFLSYIFYRWLNQPAENPPGLIPQPSSWRDRLHEWWWFSMFAVIITVTLLEPYLSGIFENMNKLKTDYFEAEFDNVSEETDFDELEYFGTFIINGETLVKFMDRGLAIIELKIWSELFNIDKSSTKSGKSKIGNSTSLVKKHNNIQLFKNYFDQSHLYKFLDKTNTQIQNGTNPNLLQPDFWCLENKLRDQIFPDKKTQQSDNPSEKKGEETGQVRNGKKKTKKSNEFCEKISSQFEKHFSDKKEHFKEDVVYLNTLMVDLSFFNGNYEQAQQILRKALNKMSQNKKEKLFKENFEKQILRCHLGIIIRRSDKITTKEGLVELIKEGQICLEIIDQMHDDIHEKIKSLGVSLETEFKIKDCNDLKKRKGKLTNFKGENKKDFLTEKFDKLVSLCKKTDKFQDSQNWEISKQLKKFSISWKNNLAYFFAKARINEFLARQYAEYLIKVVRETEPSIRSANFLDTIGYVKLKFAKDPKEGREALLFFQAAEDMIKNTESGREKTFNLKLYRDHQRKARSLF